MLVLKRASFKIFCCLFTTSHACIQPRIVYTLVWMFQYVLILILVLKHRKFSLWYSFANTVSYHTMKKKVPMIFYGKNLHILLPESLLAYYIEPLSMNQHLEIKQRRSKKKRCGFILQTKFLFAKRHTVSTFSNIYIWIYIHLSIQYIWIYIIMIRLEYFWWHEKLVYSFN